MSNISAVLWATSLGDPVSLKNAVYVQEKYSNSSGQVDHTCMMKQKPVIHVFSCLLQSSALFISPASSDCLFHPLLLIDEGLYLGR